MAHLEKFKKDNLIGVIKHDERRAGDGVQARKNESIDPSRTGLNYNLAARYGTPILEYISGFFENTSVKKLNRSDVNLMASWVVTAPKALPPERVREFMLVVYNALRIRYGYQENGYTNILTAAVHLDETTPHLHFGFIPISDNARGVATVSFDRVCPRSEYRACQVYLDGIVRERFGDECALLDGSTRKKGGNESLEDLKAHSRAAREAVAKVDAQAKIKGKKVVAPKETWEAMQAGYAHGIIVDERIKNLSGDINYLLRELRQTEQERESIRQENQSLKERLDAAEDEIDTFQRAINYIRPSAYVEVTDAIEATKRGKAQAAKILARCRYGYDKSD